MGATGPHFSDLELQCHGTTCGPDGTGCHENHAQQSLVDVLEKIRAIVGKPVLVIDAYRCLKHNMGTTGAAADSQHPNGRAADIKVGDMSAAELEAIATQIPEIRGIGRDDKRGMLHVDTRPTLTLARWCYHTGQDGKTSWVAYFPPPTHPAIVTA